MSKISDVVKLREGYANFVELKSAFEASKENADRMSMYRPTQAHRKALRRLFRGLSNPMDKKFYLLSGSYGTGKSHLSLMYANLMSRSSSDPELKGFYDTYEKLDPSQGETLRSLRKSGQFLVAICDYHSGRRFEDVVLKAIFEACASAGLDTELESEFDEAERQLAAWEKKGGSGVRDFYADFGAALEQVSAGLTVGQLRKDLREVDSNALEAFRKAYQEMMGGMRFQSRADNLIVIVKKLLKSEAFKERFKGVVVLFDEFGYTLEKQAYSKDVLHGFMEKLCQGEHNVFFMGCIHKGFKDYADRGSAADASVMSARVTEVPLLNEGVEEIIGSIVEVDREAAAWREEVEGKLAVLDQLLPLCETHKLFPWIEDSAHIRKRVLEDIYGVHPMALSCLLSLSATLGSNVRSTFTFFTGDVGASEGSYPDFIRTTELTVNGGKLSLYTADGLFRFFEQELSSRNPELRDTQRPLVNGYYASLEALQKKMAGDLVDEMREERVAILRTILIYQLCGFPANLETIQFGRYALSKSEKKNVEHQLKFLVDSGALFFRQQSNTYELAVSGTEDPYDLIDRYMKNKDLHPVDLVGALLSEAGQSTSPSFLEAKQHNLHYSEDKRLLRLVRRAKDLDETLWDQLEKDRLEAMGQDVKGYEGTVVYALCEDEGEMALAKEAAEKIASDRVLVSIPNTPQPFQELLLKVLACKHYLPPNEADKISAQTEARLRDIFEDPSDGFLPVLRRLVRKILDGEAATFYQQGGKVLVEKPLQSHKPADLICDRLFTKRSRIKHADLNLSHEDKWRRGRNTALRQALEMLLTSEQVFIDNGNPENHGEKRYLENVLFKKAGALIKRDSKETMAFFDVTADPAQISEDFPLLKDLCAKMAAAKPSTLVDLGFFIRSAKDAPFGAGGIALLLSLAVVIRAYGESLRLYKDSTGGDALRLTFDDLVEHVANPGCSLHAEVRQVTAPQRELVDGIALEVGAKSLQFQQERTVASAMGALRVWWKDVPPLAKCEDAYPVKMRKRVGDFVALIRKVSDLDGFDLLLTRLPVAYLGEDVGSKLTKEDVSHILKEFKTDIQTLQSGPARVQEKIVDKLNDLFGSTGDVVELEQAVRQWYQDELNPAQRKVLRYQEEPEAEAVVLVLADDSIGFRAKLMNALPKRLHMDEVENWHSNQTEDYVAKWRQAKTAIEREAVEIPAPKIVSCKGVENRSDNEWCLEQDSSLRIQAEAPGKNLCYTLDGSDPRQSPHAVRGKGVVSLENPAADKSQVTLCMRAYDDEGNWGPPLKVRLVNKVHEYKVEIKAESLYAKEAVFKFPNRFEDLITVLLSLTEEGRKAALLSESEAQELEKTLRDLKRKRVK